MRIGVVKEVKIEVRFEVKPLGQSGDHDSGWFLEVKIGVSLGIKTGEGSNIEEITYNNTNLETRSVFINVHRFIFL